jgi:hypothetical protein
VTSGGGRRESGEGVTILSPISRRHEFFPDFPAPDFPPPLLFETVEYGPSSSESLSIPSYPLSRAGA